MNNMIIPDYCNITTVLFYTSNNYNAYVQRFCWTMFRAFQSVKWPCHYDRGSHKLYNQLEC